MPARRVSRRHRFRKSHASKTDHKTSIAKKLKLFVLLLTVLIVAGLLLKTFLRAKYWDPNGKLSVAVQRANGDVQVLVFDTELEEIFEITIPGNVQVQAAGNFGIWKLKSLWGLGESEKLEGEILVRTLTQHFKFPVYTWSDESLVRLLEKNPVTSLKSAVYPFETNLSLGDKVRISLFSMRVANVKRENIDLTQTNFLRRTKLKDGEDGYELSGYESPRLYSKFNDSSFVRHTLRVVIRDGTGRPESAQNVGSVLEVMGAKISLITKTSENMDHNCEVLKGKDGGLEESVEKISLVLGCEIIRSEVEGNFDVEIRLGKLFR